MKRTGRTPTEFPQPAKQRVAAAYVEARGRFQGQSTVRLRWTFRRLGPQREQLDSIGLAELAALRDELRDRGALS